MVHAYWYQYHSQSHMRYYTSDEFIVKLAKGYKVLDDVVIPAVFFRDMDLDQVCISNLPVTRTVSHI
jgi:hypothetical protein